MAVSEMLTTRNEDFAARRFTAGLRMMPSLKTIIIGCVDPRVDPAAVLGAAPGEIAAIRNVGGRVTPGVRREVAMLRKVTLAAGGDLGPGWELRSTTSPPASSKLSSSHSRYPVRTTRPARRSRDRHA